VSIFITLNLALEIIRVMLTAKLSSLEDESGLQKFQDTLARYNVSISALSCHGNPLQPDPERAKHNRGVSRNSILLAEQLGVPVVIDNSRTAQCPVVGIELLERL
jgi:sugar phosphate isomerase/epimerase